MNELYTAYDPELAKLITETGQKLLQKLIEQLGVEQ